MSRLTEGQVDTVNHLTELGIAWQDALEAVETAYNCADVPAAAGPYRVVYSTRSAADSAWEVWKMLNRHVMRDDGSDTMSKLAREQAERGTSGDPLPPPGASAEGTGRNAAGLLPQYPPLDRAAVQAALNRATVLDVTRSEYLRDGSVLLHLTYASPLVIPAPAADEIIRAAVREVPGAIRTLLGEHAEKRQR